MLQKIPVCKALYNNIPSLFGASAPDEGGILLPESEFITWQYGRDLMTRDEISVMDGSKCILQLRGVRPFLSDKYDITRHPSYKYTSDFDKKYTFDIEKYLNRRMRLKAEDEYEVISVWGDYMPPRT